MSNIHSIRQKWESYQRMSLGSTPNTIGRKIAANNDLYRTVTDALMTIRGEQDWATVAELTEISDQLAIDKQTAADLLSAVRGEDLQYVSIGDLTQDRTSIEQLLFGHGHKVEEFQMGTTASNWQMKPSELDAIESAVENIQVEAGHDFSVGDRIVVRPDDQSDPSIWRVENSTGTISRIIDDPSELSFMTDDPNTELFEVDIDSSQDLGFGTIPGSPQREYLYANEMERVASKIASNEFAVGDEVCHCNEPHHLHGVIDSIDEKHDQWDDEVYHVITVSRPDGRTFQADPMELQKSGKVAYEVDEITCGDCDYTFYETGAEATVYCPACGSENLLVEEAEEDRSEYEPDIEREATMDQKCPECGCSTEGKYCAECGVSFQDDGLYGKKTADWDSDDDVSVHDIGFNPGESVLVKGDVIPATVIEDQGVELLLDRNGVQMNVDKSELDYHEMSYWNDPTVGKKHKKKDNEIEEWEEYNADAFMKAFSGQYDGENILVGDRVVLTEEGAMSYDQHMPMDADYLQGTVVDESEQGYKVQWDQDMNPSDSDYKAHDLRVVSARGEDGSWSPSLSIGDRVRIVPDSMSDDYTRGLAGSEGEITDVTMELVTTPSGQEMSQYEVQVGADLSQTLYLHDSELEKVALRTQADEEFEKKHPRDHGRFKSKDAPDTPDEPKDEAPKSDKPEKQKSKPKKDPEPEFNSWDEPESESNTKKPSKPVGKTKGKRLAKEFDGQVVFVSSPPGESSPFSHDGGTVVGTNPENGNAIIEFGDPEDPDDPETERQEVPWDRLEDYDTGQPLVHAAEYKGILGKQKSDDDGQYVAWTADKDSTNVETAQKLAEAFDGEPVFIQNEGDMHPYPAKMQHGYDSRQYQIAGYDKETGNAIVQDDGGRREVPWYNLRAVNAGQTAYDWPYQTMPEYAERKKVIPKPLDGKVEKNYAGAYDWEGEGLADLAKHPRSLMSSDEYQKVKSDVVGAHVDVESWASVSRSSKVLDIDPLSGELIVDCTSEFAKSPMSNIKKLPWEAIRGVVPSQEDMIAAYGDDEKWDALWDDPKMKSTEKKLNDISKKYYYRNYRDDRSWKGSKLAGDGHNAGSRFLDSEGKEWEVVKWDKANDAYECRPLEGDGENAMFTHDEISDFQITKWNALEDSTDYYDYYDDTVAEDTSQLDPEMTDEQRVEWVEEYLEDPTDPEYDEGEKEAALLALAMDGETDYTEEFEMGVEQETEEHSDTLINPNVEIPNLVEDHLEEDPQYYSEED